MTIFIKSVNGASARSKFCRSANFASKWGPTPALATAALALLSKVLTAPQREAKFFMLFYETNPLHRLARLNCLAPALLVTDESAIGLLASTVNFSGCCASLPKGPDPPDLPPPRRCGESRVFTCQASKSGGLLRRNAQKGYRD